MENAFPPFNWAHWAHKYNVAPNPPTDILRGWASTWSPYIKRGDTCIDVGAYTGDTMLPMAILTGPSGHVIAFEPNHAVLPTTIANSRQPEHIAPITVVAAAANRHSGTATFHYSDPDFCNGGRLLTPRDYKVNHIHPQKVILTPLAPFITPDVAFIKLDTEGNDLDLIRIICETHSGPRLTIQTEIYPDESVDERAAHLDYLLSQGFELRTIAHQPLNIDAAMSDWLTDVIATRGS